MSRTVHEGFAERFEQALAEAGLADSPRKELAELFGLSAQGVQKWRNGEAIPTAERAPLVASALGVRRAWLIDGEPPMRAFKGDITEKALGYDAENGLSLSGEEYRLLTHYRKLPRKLQQDVASLLAGISKMQVPK